MKDPFVSEQWYTNVTLGIMSNLSAAGPLGSTKTAVKLVGGFLFFVLFSFFFFFFEKKKTSVK